MDDSDFWIGVKAIAGVLLLVAVSSYGTYKYGRIAERRSLYEALSSSVEATYYDGLQDGYKKGWKEAVANYQDEPEEDGRY